MSSKVVQMDKENSSGLFHMNKMSAMNNGRVFGDNIKKDKIINHLSTPKQVISDKCLQQKQQSVIHSKQRKALGDVFNTTSNKQVPVTPKAQKGGHLTPNKNAKGLKMSLKTETANNDISELPPVEKCHIYNDNFDDLFETGKISDLFLNKNVNFIPSMPTGYCAAQLSDKKHFEHFETINDENNWHKQMKSLNKMMRKERKNDRSQFEAEFQMELPDLEMPSILLNF